jgi:hypothetical protein
MLGAILIVILALILLGVLPTCLTAETGATVDGADRDADGFLSSEQIAFPHRRRKTIATVELRRTSSRLCQ